LAEIYEEAMLRRGEMDERMFIPKDVQSVFDAANDSKITVFGFIWIEISHFI
jgi:hypothetical protein